VKYVRSVSGASLCGPRHLRAGRGNEDALGWRSFNGSDSELRTVAVVADGHGSEVCSRSDRGAALAVECGLLAAEEVLTVLPEGAPDRARMMVQQVKTLWNAAVDADLQQRPLGPTQSELIAAASPTGDPRIAYGCTMLIAAVTATEVLLGQIGDGEIAALTQDGAGWFPLGPNPQHQPGASDSLCLPGAEQRARTASLDAQLPAMLMLMTDGCTNAYQSRDELLLVGADTVRLEEETGLRRANLALETWVASTAERTEDDATLVAVWL
jgi:serine/threonine protein phosphatase PrpC